MLLQASVILSTGGTGGGGGVSASVHAGSPCPPEQTPPEQKPARADSLEQTPPGADIPQSRHPPEQTPLGADTPGADTPWSRPPWEQTPPGADTPPPQEADSGIWLMSGRYASYWNAILFFNVICRKGAVYIGQMLKRKQKKTKETQQTE